jgi:RimJ/RimL family protein N-acetyltransferase
MRAEIETERLVLRDYTPDDAEGALVMYADPDVMRFLGGVQQRTVPELRAWLETICSKYDAYRARGLAWCAMAALEKASGMLIGTALLKPLPSIAPGSTERVDTDEIEIGWHLSRAAWGRGFASEIGRAMRDRAFTTTSINVVHAVVDPANVRSERVAERIGMLLAGTTDRFYGKTLLDYRVTREVWEKAR